MTSTLNQPSVIAQRDLRNNSSDILRRAHEGEVFIVTVNGVQMAQLSPMPDPVAPRPPRRVVRPARTDGWHGPKLVSRPVSIQETLDELRADR